LTVAIAKTVNELDAQASETITQTPQTQWLLRFQPNFDWFNRPRNPSNPDSDGYDQSQTWKPEEIQLDDGRTLVLDYT
jgi:hypothetical protein